MWDKVWEEVFCQQPWGKYPAEDLIRFVARNFYAAKQREKIKILEVGCGPGSNLWYMAREGFCVFGIDGSETAIRIAGHRLDSECPRWKGGLTTGDFTSLLFDDNFFDAVIDNEAVYCNDFESSQLAYREMARVTKPGGKLFSRTFAKGSWGDETGKKTGHNAWIVSEGPLLGKGYSRFTELSEIEELFQSFSISSIELLTRTMDNQKHAVQEWLIDGVKPKR